MSLKLKLCLLGVICSCLLGLCYEQKKIIFTRLQCPTKSNRVIQAECFLEDETVLSVHIVSNSSDIFELVGIAELRASIFGQKKEIRFKNFRLDICKILSSKSPATFVGYLEKGIKKTFYNFPKKCPLKQNTSYRLQHMRFDTNYFPAYLPEYNFTFMANFRANNVNSFDIRLTGSFCYRNNDCTGAGLTNLSGKAA